MDKIIYTDRLILRQFTKDDIKAIFDVQKDKEVNTYLPWYPLECINLILIIIRIEYIKNIGINIQSIL